MMQKIANNKIIVFILLLFFMGMAGFINPLHANSALNSTDAVSSQYKQQLIDQLLTTHSLTGNFSQQLVNPEGVMLTESQGNFALTSPGLFYWHVTEPNPQTIIVNKGQQGSQAIFIDPDLEQATIRPLADSRDQLPVLLLTGSDQDDLLAALASFVVNKITDQGQTTFVLTTNQSDSLVQEIQLVFNHAGQLVQINFTNALMQQSIITFSQIAANQPIDPVLFQAEIPDDYDLVQA